MNLVDWKVRIRAPATREVHCSVWRLTADGGSMAWQVGAKVVLSQNNRASTLAYEICSTGSRNTSTVRIDNLYPHKMEAPQASKCFWPGTKLCGLYFVLQNLNFVMLCTYLNKKFLRGHGMV